MTIILTASPHNLTIALPRLQAAASTSPPIKRCEGINTAVSHAGDTAETDTEFCGDILSNIRLGILTSAMVAASTLSAQAGISQQAPTEHVGSKDVLHSVDLGSKMDSAQARSLRSMRLEPGGIAELHSDIGGPTLLHVIKGTLTSHPKDEAEAVLHAGDGFVEAAGRNYWIENTGTEPVEFIFLHVYDNRVR